MNSYVFFSFEKYALEETGKTRFGFRIPIEAWPLPFLIHPRLHPTLVRSSHIHILTFQLCSLETATPEPFLGLGERTQQWFVIHKRMDPDERPMKSPGVGRKLQDPTYSVESGAWAQGQVQQLGPADFSPHASPQSEWGSLAVAHGHYLS